MNEHEYEYDKLVIGGSLSSLIYAYHNSLHIVWTNLQPLYFFDKTKEGIPKERIAKKLAFLLSLAGLAPFGDKIDSYREEEGLLKLFGKEPYSIKVRAKEIIYFDKSLNEEENKIFEVIDWADVRSGMLHPHDFLESKNKFVKFVHFYKTNRIDGDQVFKDAVAISYLNSEQLKDLDFSETYVRLKLMKMMGDAKITGKANGYYKGKQKFLSPKLEISKREVRVNDSKREDKLLEEYSKKEPTNKQLTIWSDVLGEPYD